MPLLGQPALTPPTSHPLHNVLPYPTKPATLANPLLKSHCERKRARHVHGR